MNNNQEEKTEIDNLLSLEYQQVVDYLLEKYGHAKYDYMSENWATTRKSSRGKEGLYMHHIDEDKAIMLSTKSFAMKQPFEYQRADRLVYCNLLEHLILHIKITEMPSWDGNCGIGGVYCFIIPELNDIYAGIEYKMPWKQTVSKIVREKENDYWIIIKYLSQLKQFNGVPLMSSFNSSYNLWSDQQNKKIYEKMSELGLNILMCQILKLLTL